VQRGEAIAPVHGGAGVRGWAPRGTPVPNRYPKTKQYAGSEGSTAASFWVNVNRDGTECSERTRSTRDLAPRSRIHQMYQTSESRGNGDCGRRRRREIVRLGNMAGERTRHGPWHRDRHGGAPACKIKIARGAPDAGGRFGTARPNRASDDGIPLAEPQTGASRRTILGARNGLQWAAHLELPPILPVLTGAIVK
jgi:hypothetical protein